MGRIISSLRKRLHFIFGKVISIIMYDKKYLDNTFFSSWDSPGWEWAIQDFWGRMHYDQNRNVPWPVFPNSFVPHPHNIIFHPSSLNVFHSSGCYFQASGAKIIIGKNCWIAQNVGIVTTNHDLMNPDNHQEGKNVEIGDNCWIGMNSVILPGVQLGPHCVVGAGSVVTKSFIEGYCVICGNPAKLIKNIKTDVDAR